MNQWLLGEEDALLSLLSPYLGLFIPEGVYNTATIISFPPRDNGLAYIETLTLWILHPALSYSQAYTTHAVKLHCARLALAKLTKGVFLLLKCSRDETEKSRIKIVWSIQSKTKTSGCAFVVVLFSMDPEFEVSPSAAWQLRWMPSVRSALDTAVLIRVVHACLCDDSGQRLSYSNSCVCGVCDSRPSSCKLVS